ncbi:MAG: hypothetical protein WC841_00375 [Candidatus Shapirobacteria bacterium]|jgi:hypothetical protein
MKNNKVVGYFLLISIFSFLAIFVYLVQKSYSNLIGPIGETKASNLTKPIDPVLDVETINLIEQRKEYTQDSIVLPIPMIPTPSS